MFGDSLLVAPKLQPLTECLYDLDHPDEDCINYYSVQAYLPDKDSYGHKVIWYNYQSKQQENSGLIQKWLTEEDQGAIYVKGGKILPIKMHKG